jgi:hypothetical protein
MLPGNRYRVVLEVSSVNFELRSEAEQDVLIDTYQSFLNSLSCPLQFVVRVRELDIDAYLGRFQARLADEQEEVYQMQIQSYCQFVQSLVAHNRILSRRFYIIIPYTRSEKGDFEMAREQLKVQCDIVQKGLLRLGMQSYPLDSLGVLDLFYSFYSPEAAKLRPMSIQVLEVLSSDYIRKGRQA